MPLPSLPMRSQTGRSCLRTIYLLAVTGCLLTAMQARSGDDEGVVTEKLPQAVDSHIRVIFPNAKVLSVQKETEDGKECYFVGIIQGEQTSDLYVSPDGNIVVLKHPVFSLATWRKQLAGGLVVVLVPGVVAGFFSRWLSQVAMRKRLSIWVEWLSAWVGAAICIAILLSQVASVPREKDILVIGLLCVVWGAISASCVEAIVMTVQSYRGSRIGCRHWIIGCCFLGFVFLALSIPVDMLRISRENQHFKALAMRPSQFAK
jgi:hypothetical protein